MSPGGPAVPDSFKRRFADAFDEKADEAQRQMKMLRQAPIRVKRQHESKETENQANKKMEIATVLSGGNLVNFYDVLPKQYQQKIDTYPNYEKIKIKIPFQGILVAKTGGGKTNALFNLFSGISVFDRVWLIAKNTDEPLYAWLIDELRGLGAKHGREIITVSNDVSDFPDMHEVGQDLAKTGSRGLLIVDDMVNEDKKKLKNIMNAYIMGRKAGVVPGKPGGGLSCVFISQAFYPIPKIIRQQASLILLGNLTSKRDLNRIAAEYSLSETPGQLASLHKMIMDSGPMNFFTIDLTQTRPEEKHLKYRRNFASVM